MAIGKILAQLSSDQPRVKYRKVNLYVRAKLGLLFRKLTAREGMRVGDLARTLIMVGMVVHLLTVDGEALRKLHLVTARAQGSKRPYSPFRDAHRGRVRVGVWLPTGLLTFVDQYARYRGDSRSIVLESFLQFGMQSYLRGRKRLMRAQAEETKLGCSTP